MTQDQWMKEAERLTQLCECAYYTHLRVWGEHNDGNLKFSEEFVSKCENDHKQARAALLAHLQQRPLPVREGSHRWNIERDGDDLLVCFDLHDKGQPCEYERFVRSPSLPVREEPTGWKLVPVEPTDEMRRAGVDAYNANTSAMFFYVWKAMLAASPSVQNTGEGETGKDGVDLPDGAKQ